jgi:hypothetical protein
VNTQTKGLPTNIISKIIIALAASTLLTQVALALSDTNKPSDYSVIALKNCEVVSDKANLESIDYDQIRVLTPDSHTTKLSCDGDIKVSVI